MITTTPWLGNNHELAHPRNHGGGHYDVDFHYFLIGVFMKSRHGQILLRLISAALLAFLNAGVKADVANQLSVGSTHACALNPSGSMYCWGANGNGQLGIGSTSISTIPLQVNSLNSNVKFISAGTSHTCAVLTDSTAKCWGINNYGQIGDNSLIDRNSPVAVSGLTNVATISSGWTHTCALLQTGGVKCWGLNAAGQLGDSTTASPKKIPVTVLGLSDAIALAVGGGHSCALRATGTVVCWGSNTNGQLGNGSTANATTPAAVIGLTNIAEVTAGQYHTCARKATGEAYCWGSYTYGELGIGMSGTGYISTPQSVTALGNAVAQIQAHPSNPHTCARMVDGTLNCWGLNANGQLGTGTTVNSSSPVPVTLINSTATKLAVGGFAGCANINGVGTMCWGNNSAGTRGSGHTGGSNIAEHVVGF